MKRITLFAGHYGSGKTNIALNYARYLKKTAPRVIVADLDIVNPYFRTKDSAAELAREGIELVVSEFANSNVDFPALPKDLYRVFAEGESPYVIADIGGDDRGALALGRYAPDILAGEDWEYLAVVNAARPLTRTVADTVETLREIEAASSGLRFTGIVNNTNLGPDTTAATVLDSLPYAEGVAAALGVPLRFTSVRADLASVVAASAPPGAPIFPLSLQNLYYQLA